MMGDTQRSTAAAMAAFSRKPAPRRRDIAATADPDPGPRPAPATSTAADLMGREFPPIRWVVDGLFQEGSCYLLAGKSKVGKSRLVLSIVVAASTGGRVLGKLGARGGDVLYLSLEDGERRLQERIAQMTAYDTGADLSRLHYRTHWDPLDAGGAEDLESWLDLHPDCGLIVIDTLVRVRGQSGQDRQSLYSLDYQALAPLADMAHRRRVGVLVVHHTRKAEAEDPIDAISGSMGLSAAVDGALILTRKRQSADGELSIVGRDTEDRTLSLKLDHETGGWLLIGDADEQRLTLERREVLEALHESGMAMKPGELAIALGKSANATGQLLWKLKKEGLVIQRSYGAYVLAPDALQRISGDSSSNTDKSSKTEHESALSASKSSKTEHDLRSTLPLSPSKSSKTDPTPPGIAAPKNASKSKSPQPGPTQPSLTQSDSTLTTLTTITGLFVDSDESRFISRGYLEQIVRAVVDGGGRLWLSDGRLAWAEPDDSPDWLAPAVNQFRNELAAFLATLDGQAVGGTDD